MMQVHEYIREVRRYPRVEFWTRPQDSYKPCRVRGFAVGEHQSPKGKTVIHIVADHAFYLDRLAWESAPGNLKYSHTRYADNTRRLH
jgi:hypothetical protein